MGKHFGGPESQLLVQDIDGIDLSSKHTRHNRKERNARVGFFGRAAAAMGILATAATLFSGPTHKESAPRIEFAASSTEICAATVPDGGGNVSSPYGENRVGYSHGGIDCTGGMGSPIKAAQAGEVIDAGPASGFGQWVRIRHADGTVAIYGHMETIDVSVGQQVNAGDVIATVGSRGESTGPHLHFEMDPDMNPEHANLNVNPSAPAPQAQPNIAPVDPRAEAPLTQGFEDLVRTLPGQQGFEVPPELQKFVENLVPKPAMAAAEITTPIQAETIPEAAPAPVYEAPVVAPALPTIEELQQNAHDGFQDLQAKIQQDFANVLAGFPPLPGEPQPQQ